MIVGVGVDLVDIDRFSRHLTATPQLNQRLFAPGERELPLASLAARFAAKEATIKALGGPIGTWHEVWVERTDSGAPVLRLEGEVAERARALGVSRQHVSLSHDGAFATATVILEAE